MRRAVLSTLALLLAAGCGGGSDSPLNVEVIKSRGGLQCGSSGRSIEELRQQLVDADIDVAASTCGSDGVPYPDVCGAPDGAIGVFSIPVWQVEAAAALRFVPLSSLDTAFVEPCPS